MSDQDERLRALLASQGELVGSLAHDLKGLLTSLDGGMYMLSSGVKKGKPERIDKGQEILKRNLSRMRRTVASAMYYVKDRSFDCSPVDLQQLVAGVHKALNTQAEHLEVPFELHAAQGSFDGDELAAHSILLNIAEYALDGCHLSKAPAAAVTGSVALRDGVLSYDVVGQGFCIAADTRKIALGEHYATRSGDRGHLGLFIAHKVVQSLGGSFDITSESETARTDFRVRLPVATSART